MPPSQQIKTVAGYGRLWPVMAGYRTSEDALEELNRRNAATPNRIHRAVEIAPGEWEFTDSTEKFALAVRRARGFSYLTVLSHPSHCPVDDLIDNLPRPGAAAACGASLR